EPQQAGHRLLIEVMMSDMFANPRRSMSFYRYDPESPAHIKDFFSRLDDNGWCQRFISGTYFDVLRSKGRILNYYIDLVENKGHCLPLEYMIQVLCVQ
ncbi:unnamed protein product, partial [Amoebophrya sp. A25]